MGFSVDVIIPVYNAEKFINLTINSVLNQTYKINKIIIVDDGSIDQSANIIQEFTNTNKNIIFIKKENSGPNSARNTGLQHSCSEFVAFLDADDMWEPDKIIKQISVFKNTKFKNLGIVYTNYTCIDKNNNLILKNEQNRITPIGNIYEKLLFGNFITGSASSVLIRNEAFNNCGNFCEKLKCSEDWEMWLRISKNYTFDFINEPLVKIRKLNNSNSKNDKNNIEGYFYIAKSILNIKNKTFKEKQAILFIIAVAFNYLIKKSKNKIKTFLFLFSQLKPALILFIIINIGILPFIFLENKANKKQRFY